MRHRNLCILTIAVMACVSVGEVRAAGLVTVDPAIIRLTMQPGERWQGQVSVRNESGQPMTILATSANLVDDGNGESIRLSTDLAQRLGTLAAWLTSSPDHITLQSAEAATVHLSIDAPTNASPGHHRGLVILTVQPGGPTADALSSEAAVSVGVDLDIVGQTSHHIELLDVVARAYAGIKPPVTIQATVRNSGNTLPALSVRAEAGRLWGATSVVTLMPVAGAGTVPPGTDTVFRGVWPGTGVVPVGLFKVHVIGRDSSGTYDAFTYFILVPWPVIAGLAVAILAVLLGPLHGLKWLRKRRPNKTA